jgi:hypothetical protein
MHDDDDRIRQSTLAQKPMHDDKIRQFMLEEKPEWVKPVDTALMVYFMTIADEKGYCFPTQTEISAAVGGGEVNLSGIRNSINRLIGHFWLWRDKKAIGQRNIYQVLFDTCLPGKEETIGEETQGGESVREPEHE